MLTNRVALERIICDFTNRWKNGDRENMPDVWLVASDGDAWFGDGNAADVELMADDGNFLVAVIPCNSRDREEEREPWSQFVGRLRARGNVLRQDTLNCDIHRLVVLMVLPENNTIRDEMVEAISSDTRAEFRTLLLPSRELDEDAFVEEIRRVRLALGPLPAEKFLGKVEEERLAESVDADLLPEGRGPMADDLAQGVLEDIRLLLRGDTWGPEENWPSTRAAIARRAQGLQNSTKDELR
jgi:hypothetical protein